MSFTERNSQFHLCVQQISACNHRRCLSISSELLQNRIPSQRYWKLIKIKCTLKKRCFKTQRLCNCGPISGV